MALALNRFQTETLEVTTSNQTAYTAPTGYTSIILYAHVTNVGSSAATVTMSHVRSSTTTQIIKEGTVPVNDAFIPKRFAHHELTPKNCFLKKLLKKLIIIN